ncbi:hypothetical protein ACFOJE_20690 [Azotobacter bryophylli]|uniref:Uncharacterized protein n=1 Tax=Azotobacter bryophylli TaxID=1986537 RepID=A0ABV7AYG6_9GAMM
MSERFEQIRQDFEAWAKSRSDYSGSAIELPEYDLSLERSNGIDECREAIEAAGIHTR